MAKEAYDKIASGLEEALAIARGEADPLTYRVHLPAAPGVRALRKRLKLTQEQFSARFGVPLSTLRDWEQGRRLPERPAQVLLKVIETDPEAVARAVRAARL